MSEKDIKSGGLTGTVASMSSNLRESVSFLADIKEAGWEKVVNS
jgi:hypothetical protein